MWGEGRQAVYDPDRSMLFTLYTRQRPQPHAFVHTLSLADGWAYCIDLPEPFGHGPAAGHTIARSPFGGALYTIDATSGSIAVIDPSALAVSRVGKIAAGSGAAASVMMPDERTLFLSAGGTLARLDPVDLSTTNRWTVPAPVRGIAAGPDGQRIYVGQPDSVLALEPAGGAVVDSIKISGLKKLRHAGTA
jgi:DNA-binding beta-propeller fold protein YncE